MKYLGNCADKIDWDSVLKNYLERKGNPNVFWDKIPDGDSTDAFEMIGRTWDDAGYTRMDPAIQWDTFFQLEPELVKQLGEILDATPWYVWISHIGPGKMFPWHIDDKPSYHGNAPKDGTDVRVTFIIQDPKPGFVSIVEHDNIYLPKKGDMYDWEDWSKWHCGMNLGFDHKWQLNFWGYR